jgi:class 3 adenylate cyclase
VALWAATRLCDADYGALYMVDGELLRSVDQHGGSPEHAEYERNHPHTKDRHTLVGRVAVTERTVHIHDTLADPEYSWPGQEMSGYRAMLGVPILVERELIGVFGLVRNEPKPFTDEQTELVETFADQAAIAIANARLLEAVERQRSELARFVSPQVAELISSPDGERLLHGHRAYISCLFCDLRNFTAFAETAAPEELIELLGDYHTALGELIPLYHGTLEHFAGDGVMVFFNDPLSVPEHELQAVRLALAVRERFEQLADLWRKRGTELALGIGIEAGYATLGRIGFEGRYDYGALGPVTNLAARLSTQAAPHQILIGPRIYAAVEDTIEASPVGEMQLKGFARPISTYQVHRVLPD